MPAKAGYSSVHLIGWREDALESVHILEDCECEAIPLKRLARRRELDKYVWLQFLCANESFDVGDGGERDIEGIREDGEPVCPSP